MVYKKNIEIIIKDQPSLLNRIAEMYKTPDKALMEYVDNSFDSAEMLFDENTNNYTKNIEIKIEIDRKNQVIFIWDNCLGMENETLEGLANSINESNKKKLESKKRAWVNGQFGLGIHSFRFFADNLLVNTKQKDELQESILINVNDVEAHVVENTEVTIRESGTVIELRNIDKDKLKKINSAKLKEYIETYFEMLLRRNVTINIVDDGTYYICKPFDYSQIDGIFINKDISEWIEGSSISSNPKNPIEVRLYVSKKVLDRPPFFSRKGRRINDIGELSSFINKTEHRKKVWESPHLTGYIEVNSLLEPTISRDDFAGGKGLTQRRSGIYTAIIELEDDIFKALNELNQSQLDETYKNLGDYLSSLLSQLTKQDELNIKTIGKAGEGADGIRITPDEKSDELFGVDKKGTQGKKPNESEQTEEIKATRSEESDLFGKPVNNEKRGIRVEFNTASQDDINNTRATFADGVISIYINHPDFKLRLNSNNELAQIKITERLAGYLAAVISSKYKEAFYSQKKLEPDRQQVLEEQIDFIFRFEELIKNLINKPLSSIGDFTNETK